MSQEIENRLDKLEETRIPSPKELEALRILIEDHSRTKWLWSSIKTWVIGITSIITLFTIGLDGIKTILKRLVS